MIARGVAVWCLLLVVASANGFVREALLVPQMGDVVGRAVSTLTLSGFIAIVAWTTVRWIGPRTRGQAWRVGVLWVGLTLAFEFLAGHYLFRNPWSRLLEDYDVRHARIWLLVLVTTLLAPPAAAARRLRR